MRKYLVPVALLLPLACVTTRNEEVIPSPLDYPGLPSQSSEGAVWIEATFYTNHADIFESDLTRWGYLPIAVRIGVRGEDGQPYRLSEDSVDPHLYLQDGTPLNWVPYDRIDDRRNRVSDLALDLSLLPEWGDAQEGFLFFRLDDDEVRVRRLRALTITPESDRELDLLESLLSITVMTETGPRQVNVGLKSGYWSRG